MAHSTADRREENGGLTGAVVAALCLAVGTVAAGAAQLDAGRGLGGMDGAPSPGGGPSVTPDMPVAAHGGGTTHQDVVGALWRRLGLRETGRVDRADRDCAAHSVGAVRRFLTVTPCRSLDRASFTLDRGPSTEPSIDLSVAWIRFPDPEQARRFHAVLALHGTGTIAPLTARIDSRADGPALGSHRRFRFVGDTVTIAEAGSTAVPVDAAVLRTVAETAAALPRP